MNTPRLVQENGRYRLEGPVVMGTVRPVLEEGKRLFGADGAVVDLSGVTEVDSSAVSLLLEWMRQRPDHTLRFDGLPENLVSIARLYGVLETLQQSERA